MTKNTVKILQGARGLDRIRVVVSDPDGRTVSAIQINDVGDVRIDEQLWKKAGRTVDAPSVIAAASAVGRAPRAEHQRGTA